MYASLLTACHRVTCALLTYVLVAGTSGDRLGHCASKTVSTFRGAQLSLKSSFRTPFITSHLIFCLKLYTMSAPLQLLVAATLIAVTASGTAPSGSYNVLHKHHAF